ncbi:MAG: flavin reductase family protein [Methanobrevibacter sp.]|nr:flavin reductase family protein [Methanobrevibacter sp.]
MKRKTLKDILETGEFCLGFGSVDQLAEVDYLGIETGYNLNKIDRIGYTHKKGEKVNAPIINEFKVSLECRVMHIAEVGSHTQITGEIVNVQAEEDVRDSRGKIIFEKVNPIAYDDVTHSYFEVGDKVADAFKVGLDFRK